jgi:hypothetical protein
VRLAGRDQDGLALDLARTDTTPFVTLASVPAHESWTSHVVPRRGVVGRPDGPEEIVVSGGPDVEYGVEVTDAGSDVVDAISVYGPGVSGLVMLLSVICTPAFAAISRPPNVICTAVNRAIERPPNSVHVTTKSAFGFPQLPCDTSPMAARRERVGDFPRRRFRRRRARARRRAC